MISPKQRIMSFISSTTKNFVFTSRPRLNTAIRLTNILDQNLVANDTEKIPVISRLSLFPFHDPRLGIQEI